MAARCVADPGKNSETPSIIDNSNANGASDVGVGPPKQPSHSARQAAACKQKWPPDSPQAAQANGRARTHPPGNIVTRAGREKANRTAAQHTQQHNTNSAVTPRFVRVHASQAHATVAGGLKFCPFCSPRRPDRPPCLHLPMVPWSRARGLGSNGKCSPSPKSLRDTLALQYLIV